MLSNTIKVKLEKNSYPFKELEKFFASGTVFHIDDQKGFKDSSVKLVMKHYYFGNKILTLTLPREAIPNSLALGLLSALHKENALALPIILKYFAHRNLSDDFDKISQELQNKINQDIQVQNDSETSGKIKLCGEDILNILNGGKSVLDNQLKQHYGIYYSTLLNSEVTKLKAKISRELENDNNTNIYEVYKNLHNKRGKTKLCNEIVGPALCTFGAAAYLMLFLAPFIASIPIMASSYSMYYSTALMYTTAPFLVVITLALTIAGVAYLVKRHYEQSFAKEMQDFIEGPRYMDKATNTEEIKEEPPVDDLIDLSDDGKEEPSAPPLELLDPDFSSEEELSAQPSSNFGSTFPLVVTQQKESDVLQEVVVIRG